MMERISILNYNDLPGSTKLFCDYLDNFPKVSEFYPANPMHFSNLKYRHEIVSERHYPRTELVQILQEQNKIFGASTKTFANIQKLLDPKTCAIVTGQQVGLFGGPIFTLYKAVTAIKLAEKTFKEFECPVIPIFWLASDDHDLAEAFHIAIINKSNQIMNANYDLNTIPQGTSANDVILNTSIQSFIENLFSELFDTEFKTDLKMKLLDCYSPEKSVAMAFAQWLALLLKEYGLVLINPADPRIKRLGIPLFEREIRGDSPSTKWVIQSGKLLESKGYHQQLSLHENTFNLFFHQNGRKAIKLVDGKLLIQGTEEMISKDDFCQRIHENPEKVSPNVVLRPLFQDTILPTVAYVAGPSELSYFAQLSAVYDGFHMPMPIIFPRASITILESKVQQILEKYNIDVSEIFADTELLITRVLKQSLPENLEMDLQRMDKALEELSIELQRKVQDWDPTLVKTVETTVNSMNHQLETLEKKIIAAHKKKNDTVRQQVYKAAVNLYPKGTFQERELNIIPYICKYGFDFIKELVDSINIEVVGHQIIKTS